MESTTQQDNQYNEAKVIADVPRSENDVYRLTLKEYKGRHFVDIRIFFRDKEDRDRLIPTHKGICFEESLRGEIIAGLIKARQASLSERSEGEEVRSAVVCDIPVSETEVCRISKGNGSKNTFVDVRRFFAKNGGYVPYKRKGVSINESALDDVITGLISMDSVSAS